MRKTTAILIRKRPLSDTSLIVSWCSLEQGILKTVAKGARRKKSLFAGKLDLFFEGEIEWIPSKKGDLHTLKELTVVNPRFSLRNSYKRTFCASYFIQFLEHLAERETPIPELYDLLQRGLNYLDKEAPSISALTHFEKETFKILGLLAEVPSSPSATLSLSLLSPKLLQKRRELLSLIGRGT